MQSTLARAVKRAPRTAGVYFLWAADGHARNKRLLLYIGKAANLRARLRSYQLLGNSPPAALRPALAAMLKKTTHVTWQQTASDIEALILEAALIKKHQPKYNVLLRDDKNYFFVGFTNEDCPRIFLTHQPRAEGANRQPMTATKQRAIGNGLSMRGSDYIGPFTDGGTLKRTLRMLRRIFPYATHSGFPKRCLEYDMGLCPIPPGDPGTWNLEHSILARLYRRNIRAIRDVLTGKRQALVQRLEREMHAAAKRQDFITAAKRRDEIRGIQCVFAHRTVVAQGQTHDISSKDIPQAILRHLNYGGETSVVQKPTIVRIEGYDIANLAQGKAATGSMVAFRCTPINTNQKTRTHEYVCQPSNTEYRQFRIKMVRGANDVAMIAEVLRRRFRHPEWPRPDVVLIDGGKPQLNAALTVLRNHAPLVLALAKREEAIYLPGSTEPLRLPKNHPFLLLLMHVRDEAHRFARRYHHRLRSLDS